MDAEPPGNERALVLCFLLAALSFEVAALVAENGDETMGSVAEALAADASPGMRILGAMRTSVHQLMEQSIRCEVAQANALCVKGLQTTIDSLDRDLTNYHRQGTRFPLGSECTATDTRDVLVLDRALGDARRAAGGEGLLWKPEGAPIDLERLERATQAFDAELAALMQLNIEQEICFASDLTRLSRRSKFVQLGVDAFGLVATSLMGLLVLRRVRRYAVPPETDKKPAPLPYRWGTFCGWALIVFGVLLIVVAVLSAAGQVTLVGFWERAISRSMFALGLLGSATGLGLKRRRRYGWYLFNAWLVACLHVAVVISGLFATVYGMASGGGAAAPYLIVAAFVVPYVLAGTACRIYFHKRSHEFT